MMQNTDFKYHSFPHKEQRIIKCLFLLFFINTYIRITIIFLNILFYLHRPKRTKSLSQIRIHLQNKKSRKPHQAVYDFPNLLPTNAT